MMRVLKLGDREEEATVDGGKSMGARDVLPPPFGEAEGWECWDGSLPDDIAAEHRAGLAGLAPMPSRGRS